MKRKTKLSFAVLPIALGAIVLSAALVGARSIGKIKALKADPTSYSLTLNSENAPSGLTSSFQRSVSMTATTSKGNAISFKLTNAKALDGGFATLGNHGTVYCISADDDHISGLTSITVTYSSGSLNYYGSAANRETSGEASYTNLLLPVTSGTALDLGDGDNSFYLEAGDANVNIQSIELTYSCATTQDYYDFSKDYSVDDFEDYAETGVGYDTSHGMGVATQLRGHYYSTYNGAGSNPTNGSGWSIMGSTDYLTLNTSVGHGDSQCALMKSNASNYFRYVQAKHYFGVPYAVGRGKMLSVWLAGAYSNAAGTTASSASAQVTLIAFYNKQFNTGGANDAATATYTIAPNSDWLEYTVALDETKTVYGYGIHIAKASATIYLPVDDVMIYTESPYGATPVTGVSLDSSSASMIIGETKQLTATISPQNATNKNVTWTSNNDAVASVNANGVVTAVSEGTATITVTTEDGSYTDSCAVTVTQLFPGGTYLTSVNISGMDVSIEVVLSTRSEAKVWFYGFATDGASFTSYNETSGAFVIAIEGEVTLSGIGTFTYGNMTGYYRNGQLEEVGLDGTISNLLGSVNGTITVPQPTENYWNCDGTTAELQNVFRRRWRNGSAWAYDDSNSNRIEAETQYKSSGTSGVKIRPYASGVGLVLATATDGITLDEANTFCLWLYNPSTSSVNFRFFLYKAADLSSNFEPLTARTVEAQSWYYLRIGYGTLSAAGTVYNFMVTNLGADSSVTFVVDDICFH